MRRSIQLVSTFAATAGFLAAGAPVALADNLQNALVAGSSFTFSAGGSAAVNYHLASNGSDGCNVDATNFATVTVNAPAGLTATPPSVQISACDVSGAKTVTFSSAAAGTYSVAPSVSGGKAGNNGYNTSPGKSTFTVAAAPDGTGPVVTPTLTGTLGANDWYVSDVAVSWSVTDPESAVSSSSGCGSQTLSAETTGSSVTCTATSAGGTTTVSRTIRLDKTGPTALLSGSGTFGTNDWYISNVAVTTSGADSISGPVVCTSVQNLTAETAGTTVNGSCTNAAGLLTNGAALNVKIDKTAPTNVVSAVTAGEEGTGGWYTSDVTVATTSDADLSSPVACTAPQTLTGNTGATSIAGRCTNNAGLSADSTSILVKIDQTGPTAALFVDGTLGENNWYTSDVTVSTQGEDADSGAMCSPEQFLTSDTDAFGQEFNGSCTNGAGTETAADPVTIRRDVSVPSAKLVVTGGTVGANGWHTSAVTVEIQGADVQSGVICTGGGSVLADTAGITITGFCVNGAGLRTDAPEVIIKLDTSAPSASLAVSSGSLGSDDWYTSDVTVGATGSDSISGPVTCNPETQQVTTESATNLVSTVCTNQAGLFTPAELTVKLDKSAPTAVTSAVLTGTEGLNDWYTSDVTVQTTGSDVVSGVSCSGDLLLQQETIGTDAAGSCTNGAGLETTAPPVIVKIDMTAPVVTLTPSGSLGTSGWYVDDITLVTTGTDTIAEPVICDTDQVQTAETPGTLRTGSCINDAGLSTSASVTVKLDGTGPVVSAGDPSGDAGANGWFTGPVTVAFTGADALSGPASQVHSVTSIGEGAAVAVSSPAFTDVASNTTAAGALTPTFMIDLTDPTAAFDGSIGSVYFGVVPAAPTCTATDALSGPAGCVVTGYSTAVGTHTLTATATDLASRTGTAMQTYTVQPWTFSGFYQPVDMNGVVNTVKGGSTVPLKFEVFRGATELTDPAVVRTLAKTVTCPTGAPADDVELTATGGTSLRYDSAGGQFIFNWQTPRSAGTCYSVTVTLLDGTSRTALFKTK